jgi:hypothetical protein
VVVSGVALMRSPKVVSRPCGKPPNGEQHDAASSTAMQNIPASQDQLDKGKQPFYLHCRMVLHCQTRFTTASSTVPLLLLHRRPVPHRRTSSLGVVFLCSHELLSTLWKAPSHCRSEVSLKIWPPRPAQSSPTPSLRGVLWREALYVHSS